ncbi:DUF881 domain-containing protein [Streptomyces sp. B-S-A8]|uniref:DUF881 domain-containing protein n=1 Tax=Streptomyces solicavernae TaxID=3043614 RepID=A0ABT6RUL3_9ACTN|nr:DUF881 domain-containing protein [Streptomyces sp. B-S-A8]MDI3388137.1 DUF881 domain-containing protein [Streptomyces sp. B-S-A8]
MPPEEPRKPEQSGETAEDEAQTSGASRTEKGSGTAGTEKGSGTAGTEKGSGTARTEKDSSTSRTEKGADESAEPRAEESEAALGDAGATEQRGGDGELSGRQRLARSLWPPKVSRAQLIVALLLFVLGLGLAIQVRSTSESSALRGARQEDLVRILDELDDRTQRLEDEKQRLDDQRTELENSSDQAEEARKQTIEKERQLGVLAGTVAAQGPGITLTVTDTRGAVEADMLLDAIQELRAAGAEAIQINDVRVVANTYLEDTSGGVQVDGRKVKSPYRFKVIGKPQDLAPALNIPGGVVQSLEKEQATVAVAQVEKIVVDALRRANRPDYARSSS